jgi:hypothetical protein
MNSIHLEFGTSLSLFVNYINWVVKKNKLMETPHSEKIKKYLFFVSIVFFFLISSHLVSSYIYNDAKTTPLK